MIVCTHRYCSTPLRIRRKAATASCRSSRLANRLTALRSQPRREPHQRGEIAHPASAAELRADTAKENPGDHGRGSELPDEHTDHDGGKDNSHQERTKDVHGPSSA